MDIKGSVKSVLGLLEGILVLLNGAGKTRRHRPFIGSIGDAKQMICTDERRDKTIIDVVNLHRNHQRFARVDEIIT